LRVISERAYRTYHGFGKERGSKSNNSTQPNDFEARA
jgi:hypothetical protein